MSQSLHSSPDSTRGPKPEASPGVIGSLRISETFASRQGEGSLTGVESFFIRTSGCNLRCWFCDTPYASWAPEGDRYSIDSLIAMVTEASHSHVVITGGEPLLFVESIELCNRLREKGVHVTIETAGTIDCEIACDLISISPKLRSSGPNPTEHPSWSVQHELRRMPIDVMKRLVERSLDHQIKFVLTSESDFLEVEEIVDRLAVSPEHVWIMPEGVTVQQLDQAKLWIEKWTIERGFRYCDRMQIRWYGNRRGT